MKRRKWFACMRPISVGIIVLASGIGWGFAQNDNSSGNAHGNVYGKMRSTTQAQRKAAAQNSKKLGVQLGAVGAAATLASGAGYVPPPAGTPDYFGPFSNYANSPLPGGAVASFTVVNGGSGYTAPTVTISDIYGMGTGAAAASAVVINGVIMSITGGTGGTGYRAPVVKITDATGKDAVVTAKIGPPYTGGMRKFVDTLPNLTIAQGTPCSYSGQPADCYEIWAVQYRQQMHSDLTPVTGTWPNQTGGTLLRGYVEVKNGALVSPPSYLGPVIVAQRDKPVRVTYRNKLPYGPPAVNGYRAGDLFLPVDTSYMGTGPVPSGAGYSSTETFTQNRTAVHLHGATTPWISDGTLFQWVTPAGETTSYPQGVSVYNVPDMPDPGPGSLTFFYTNQQSARLMFYHDHAAGITRLNVYGGMAAGYIVSDSNAARDPITPIYGEGIPLVIQDKTFVWGTPPVVNGSNQVTTPGTGTWATDPTWATSRWGGADNLWFPHVYMPNQNPAELSGANAMGRWDYGPWFWPPFTGLIQGPVPNPYYDPINAPWEPPQIPGVPILSSTPEAFMDTPIVNGVAYPSLTVPAGPVRFRILGVGNDRMLNLSLWVAADKTTPTTAGSTGTVLCTNNATVPPANCTEVKMVPFNDNQNLLTPFPSWWATSPYPYTLDNRAGGVPDPGTRGPAMIQIGTEGGFLPAPVVIRNQPVNYVYNRRDITVGNVLEKALFLAAAERADVIVDFTNFAGKTLILYNDAPAPVPAADPRLDYYTGSADQSDTGGAPPIIAGYGPNTRTVMQIVVSGSSAGATIPVDDVNATILASLQTALPAAFKASQDTIIVPQAAYNAVYGTTVTDSPGVNLANIQSTSLAFTPLTEAGTLQSAPVSFDLQPKSIIEDFQMDYGRMNALIGVEIPRTNNTNQTSIPQSLQDPATEVIKISDPAMSPIGTAPDGSQIWKITHNGVDTHGVHVHMFTAQILNRVGWDGAIRMPDANELGFKDTIRMNPLEDIIVALRPIKLNLPFKVPNSVRPLAPDAPLGGTTTPSGMPLFFNIDPLGNPITITNQMANFGWEYVWHCHILGHEENDMMRAMALAAPPETPSGLTASTGSGNPVLNWTDNSLIATGFTLQRAGDLGFKSGLQTWSLGKVTTYTDTTATPGQKYYYRVSAANTVGSGVPGYPQVTADSRFSGPTAVGTAVPVPSNLMVWRPTTGAWYEMFQFTYTSTIWGSSTDVPVPGDYDGDRIVDKAIYRPGNGNWYILPSSAPGTYRGVPWGTATDKPFPADYDGDGKTDIAVYRPSTGVWYILPSTLPGTYIGYTWGQPNDAPAPADYDGDGKVDVAIFRPSTGAWYILPSSAPGTYRLVQWGQTGDIPVPADYDGDSKAEIAVWRPSNATWYSLPTTLPGSYAIKVLGSSTDIPVPADFDNDGIVDMAVFTPSTATWSIIRSTSPAAPTSTVFGANGDVPISSITRIVGTFR